MKHDVWIGIAAMTVICFVIKAVGPVALGGRELPGWADRELVLDARAGGLAAAIIALALGRGMLVVLLVAAAVTAGLRALGVG